MHEPYHRTERLYFLPIGGTAMAPLAGLLAAMGHEVSGVDSVLYPPMSTLLEELGIPVRLGWDPSAVPRDVDRVILGNAVPRSNPEVAEVLARRQPLLAQAEAVAHYVLAAGRRSLVVAGTHGKTTTTALVSWIMTRTGADPTALVGGLPMADRRPFRLGAGEWLVIEGDEYNTAFFDRGPKFLHYRPEILVLGPVEYDHADLYPDLDAVLTAFRAGTAQVPRHGVVVVNGASPLAREVANRASAPVVVVGEGPDATVRLVDAATSADGRLGARLRIDGEELDLRTPLPGLHNLHNTAVAVTAAVRAGVSPAAAVAAAAEFPGVARRLEVVGESAAVVVVDDFAHHPTAVEVTVAAARERWPRRRLVVAFEPRSLSAARREFEDRYVEALAGADLVLLAPPHHAGRVPAEQLLDTARMARTLDALGVPVLAPAPGEDAVAVLTPQLSAGDLVVGCSSGDFGGFHRRLLAQLADEEA